MRKLSPLTQVLSGLVPEQIVTVEYNSKTPFSVFIAIKRQQLNKDFAFKHIGGHQYSVWLRSEDQRHMRRRKETCSMTTGSSPADQDTCPMGAKP